MPHNVVCCKSFVNIFFIFSVFFTCRYAVNWCGKLRFCAFIFYW